LKENLSNSARDNKQTGHNKLAEFFFPALTLDAYVTEKNILLFTTTSSCGCAI
jgi:hypothetical protein